MIFLSFIGGPTMKALALFFVCGIFSFSSFATVSETTCSNSDGSIVLVVDGALEVNNSSVTAIRGEDVSLVETKSEIEVVVGPKLFRHPIGRRQVQQLEGACRIRRCLESTGAAADHHHEWQPHPAAAVAPVSHQLIIPTSAADTSCVARSRVETTPGSCRDTVVSPEDRSRGPRRRR